MSNHEIRTDEQIDEGQSPFSNGKGLNREV